MGRAAGIPDFMLYGGAGFAEVFDPSHVTNGEACCSQICLMPDPAMWPSNVPLDSLCLEICAYVNPDWTQSYFDDPNDKASVEFGIRMYDTYGSTLTWRQYQEYLSLHGHELTPAPSGNNIVSTSADWPYQIGFFNGPDDVANESIISALLEK